MARSQQKSKRKASGGIYHPARSKRSREVARPPTYTKLEARKPKKLRKRSGQFKQILLSVKEANVTNSQGKTAKTEITNVINNPANPNLVRRNIITKGTIIQTKLGKAKVTSRPGQEGMVNAVLIQE